MSKMIKIIQVPFPELFPVTLWQIPKAELSPVLIFINTLQLIEFSEITTNTLTYISLSFK